MRNKYTLLYIYATLAVAMVLTACHGHTVFHHFEHTSIEGWDRSDTLYFQIPQVAEEGDYDGELEVRITDDFPFVSMDVVIERTILPSGQKHSETLTCRLIDNQGRPLGEGVSEYQNCFPLQTLHLQRGDSVAVSVYHFMRHETLKGIADVGIRMGLR
jgi:gliding motility-associated lipoprotein GldH